MSIKKMLLLASMALAAIAVMAPAAAQANALLTDPNGVKLASGSQVTATSTNLQTVTSAGTMSCQKVTLHYTLGTNGPNHVVLNPVGTHNAKAEGCHLITTNGSTHAVHIRNAGTNQLTVNTWGTGVASSTFTADITTFITVPCTFTGNVHFQADTPGGHTANVGPSTLAGSGFFCPSSGSISGDFTLETPNGTRITTDFVKTG